jgi:hypothetical protein
MRFFQNAGCLLQMANEKRTTIHVTNEAPRRKRRGIKMDLLLYLYPDFEITP